MRILVIAAIIAAVSPAYADVFPNKDAGVSIDVPKAWKKTGSGANVAIADPKEEAVLMLITTEGSDMKKAGDALDAQLAKAMKDIKWGPQKEVTHNTMKGIAIKGTATVNGKAVDIAALILVTPTKKGLFVVGAVQSDKLAAHKAEVDGIVGSIKPIK